ncbi:MAG: hypothetical protein ACRDKU_01605 [Gaiellaceae bacterium]
MWLVWTALLVGFLAIVGSIVFAVVRALELWRAAKVFATEFGGQVDSFSRSVDAVASRDPAEFARLEPALARLRRSSAQLTVLRNAIDRVRDQADAALVLYPRK